MAISADSIYSETLQSIIDAKLEELERKKHAYETSKADVLTAFSSQTDEAERVRVLKDGIKKCFQLRDNAHGGLQGPSANTDLKEILQNLDQFLEQPFYDQSLTSNQLQTWATSLEQHFDVQSARYEFASLYAKLVTEWLACEKNLHSKGVIVDVPMTDSFEELESSAKLKSRQEWESLVFQTYETDSKAIELFLDHLFGNREDRKGLSKSLEILRSNIKSFEVELASQNQFNTTTVSWSIQGLLSGELLSEEKRAVLKDFLNNNVILIEIADVLNLRLANLDNWSWGPVVPVVQTKKLAGDYSILMQEDLLQAIFLQYIGVKWSVFLKQTLKKLVCNQEAWLSTRQEITRLEQDRRAYYLGGFKKTKSVHSRRGALWLNRYFLSQLPGSEFANNVVDDGAVEVRRNFSFQNASAQHKQQSQSRSMGLANKACRKQVPSSSVSYGATQYHLGDAEEESDDDDDDDDDEFEHDNDGNEVDKSQNLMDLKQGLLHLLRTEILVSTKLHGELTGFRAQFDNWNSLLPHSTILAVAKYLGASAVWLRFFREFLQAPLGFIAGNDVEEARVRRRGVPGSHPLSDMLGEMILFCLDLSVNQTTKGHKLWRMHDDLWFWSVDHQVAVNAWAAVTAFTDVMGLKLDMNNAGSVRVSGTAGAKSLSTLTGTDVWSELTDSGTRSSAKEVSLSVDASLPQDRIRWGFLYLDSVSGEWEIDEALVDVHADELRKQLATKTDSLLSWVQAWNAYASTFFTANFGKPAKCFGRAHAGKALAALRRVQRRLFENTDSHDVVHFIQTTLAARFGVSKVPEAFCFFPTELGGLELINPFIKLLLVYGTHEHGKSPAELLDKFEQAERDGYEAAKKRFEQGRVPRSGKAYIKFMPQGEDRDVFMSFDEYAKYREELHYSYENDLREVYDELLKESTEYRVTPTSDTYIALSSLDPSSLSSIKREWNYMSPYWMWITQMYGGQIIKRFGGLNIVDNGVLPTGMVSLFRSDRVQWKA